MEAIELHYDGTDENSKSLLKQGLADLLSECGQSLHRDELFQNKPIDITGLNKMLASTQKSSHREHSYNHFNLD